MDVLRTREGQAAPQLAEVVIRDCLARDVHPANALRALSRVDALPEGTRRYLAEVAEMVAFLPMRMTDGREITF